MKTAFKIKCKTFSIIFKVLSLNQIIFFARSSALILNNLYSFSREEFEQHGLKEFVTLQVADTCKLGFNLTEKADAGVL